MVVRAGQGFQGTVNQSSALLIKNSLRFDSGSSSYLSRTPGSAGNRRTFTISFWSKGPNTHQSRLFQTGSSTGAGNYFGMSYQSGKLFLSLIHI